MLDGVGIPGVDEIGHLAAAQALGGSSRTVPFLSKATGYSLADIATKVILGESLRSQGFDRLYPEEKKRWYCKVPVFSFSKLSGLDAYLSPEMKSTGEAIGYDDRLPYALYKAMQAAGMRLQDHGTVLLSICQEDLEEALGLVRRFYRLGFNIEAHDELEGGDVRQGVAGGLGEEGHGPGGAGIDLDNIYFLLPVHDKLDVVQPHDADAQAQPPGVVQNGGV